MTSPRHQSAVPSGAPVLVRAEPPAIPERLTWWVSSDAVRQAIGAWAATARAGRTRPGMDVMRTAVGVACAMAELAADAPVDVDATPLRPRLAAGRADGGGRFALTRPVAYDVRRLAEIAGASLHDVERALVALCGAGVVSQAQGERGPLALGADYLVPAPAVASIAWAAVRDRLVAVGAPVGAPCAVLRAVGEQMGMDAVGGGTSVNARPPVRISVRDLEAFTGFRRSTVSEAVAALVRARLLDADTRAGHTGRFVLRAAAFGAPDEAPDVPAGASAESALHARATPPALTPAGLTASRPTPHAAPSATTRPAAVLTADAAPDPDGSRAGASVLVGTFAGTPIYAPVGTPLVVECDAAGRWSCRIGPYLQLGPVDGA